MHENFWRFLSTTNLHTTTPHHNERKEIDSWKSWRIMGQSTVSGVLQLEHYKRSYLKYLPLQDFCKTLTCSDLYRLLVQIKCCFDSICRDRKSLRARRLWLPQMDQYQQSWRRRSRKIRLGKTRYLHVQVCFRNYTNYNKAKGTKIVEWLTSFWECHQSGIWRNKRIPLSSDSSHDSNVTRMIRVVKTDLLELQTYQEKPTNSY